MICHVNDIYDTNYFTMNIENHYSPRGDLEDVYCFNIPPVAHPGGEYCRIYNCLTFDPACASMAHARITKTKTSSASVRLAVKMDEGAAVFDVVLTDEEQMLLNEALEMMSADTENEMMSADRENEMMSPDTENAMIENDTNVAEMPDFDAYIQSKKAKNTLKCTDNAIRTFRKWLDKNGETLDIENIEKIQLNKYLCGFLMLLKKDDGSDYEPGSILSIHRGIERFLKNRNYEESIITGKTFEKSREVLAAKMKELKESGKGNKPNKSSPLTAEEEELLWSSGQLGDQAGAQLQNTLYFLFTKGFGFRGVHESRQLCFGDISIQHDGTNEYLEFNERITKTRNGKSSTNLRPFPPKIFESENKSRCAVRMFKKFCQLRPAEMSTEDSPFFLSVNCNVNAKSAYKAVPMGANHLSKIVSKMCKSAGISGKKTNHSLRHTLITDLLHAGVPPTAVMQVSGHKNVQSINTYGTLSLNQQRHISGIINRDNNSWQTSSRERNGNAIALPEPVHTAVAGKESRPALPPLSPAATLALPAPATSTAAASSTAAVAPRSQNNVLNSPRMTQTNTSRCDSRSVFNGLFAGATIRCEVHVHITGAGPSGINPVE